MLEPKPSTSGVSYRASPPVPDHVLRKALLTLGDPASQASDWFATLASRAMEAVLDKCPYADAHQLMEGLLRRLEAEQSQASWTTAFERVVALTYRFEARTAIAARAMLLTVDKLSGDGAQALAQTSTSASIEHLIAHRLHAIADMRADTRAAAWGDLLAAVERSKACPRAQRLVPMARFIGLLTEAEQRPAALAVVSASRNFVIHGGWRDLTDALLKSVPGSEIATVARAIVHPDQRLHSADMYDTIDAISDRVDSMPERDARALLAHLIEIVMARADFVYLTFSPDESAQLLDDLRSTCRRCGFDDLAETMAQTLAEVMDDYKVTMMD
ncbi:hypothetical protein [Pandoraea oxalativorans]|uniref:Uncharacterized protein n=1 Tax=Pandoraea oxalativorans TaxID=573737 RepID=A0A0E3U6B8_9BURK|nr:hypothetical protein [Pandoraea oxalativorans]AKC69904.1 hypothetical protein MB84_11080 [Pandoraea oxalativorans]